MLVGALGGIGAVIAGAVGRASPVRAEGEAMVVGGDYNDATSATILGNSTGAATVFLAQSTAGGIGVYGYSNTNIATKGESVSSIGVDGISTSGSGVQGVSGSGAGVIGSSSSGFGVRGISSTTTGVAGSSTDGFGVIGVGNSNQAGGVKGVSSDGLGVWGESTNSTGVLGDSSGGIGVYGVSGSADEAALRGRNTGNGPGIVGASGNVTPVGPVHTGVYGYAQQDSASRGVWGASTAGHGIHGESDTGWAGYFDGRMFTNSYLELKEIAKPAAPGTNRGRLFLRDSGSGHTQLCIRFHNGVTRVIASS
jgi:hypothetical protein